jgi:hypothetical protein
MGDKHTKRYSGKQHYGKDGSMQWKWMVERLRERGTRNEASFKVDQGLTWPSHAVGGSPTDELESCSRNSFVIFMLQEDESGTITMQNGSQSFSLTS